MHRAVTEESIEKANAQFWEQMLAMRLTPVASAPAEEHVARCIGLQHAMGSCTLSGSWNGRIEVRLSRSLALTATSTMLMQPEEQVQEGDILDAIKEIANMVAGTLKSALPRPCAMTVPSAEIASGDFCVPLRTSDAIAVFFAHDAGELMVRVWEQTAVEECLAACR